MKKIYDITVLGGCSIDYIYYEDSTLKRKVPGGKGANQAVAAARMGAKVNMISRLANNKESIKLIDNLRNNNIEVKDIDYVNNKNDIAKVYINKNDKDNKVIRTINTSNEFKPDMILKYKDDILKSKLIIAQMKIPKKVTTKLIELCYENKIPIIITPNKSGDLKYIKDKELIDKITYITANKKECIKMFDNNNIEEAVTLLRKKLIVTLGSDGVIYHNGKDVVKIPAFKVTNICDTIGAGDTFCGALAALLVSGDSLDKAIFKAQAAAAIKLHYSSPQEGMPTLKEINDFLNCYNKGIKYKYEKKQEFNL